MRNGGGKQKGSAFERQICVALSKWVSHGEHEDLFWRSAMSGGRSTVAAKQGKALRRQSGDISAVSSEGCVLTDNVYIECRFYAKLDIEAFLLHRRGHLAQFWREVTKQAKHYDKKPWLIAKQNRSPIILVTKDCLLCQPLASFSTCDISLFDDLMKTKFNEDVL